MKISSRRIEVTSKVYADAPTDKFEVRFGYKDRSSLQIRLEKDGSVYASVFPEHISDGAAVATVPFNMFVNKFREFVHHLAAYHHEKTKEC